MVWKREEKAFSEKIRVDLGFVQKHLNSKYPHPGDFDRVAQQKKPSRGLDSLGNPEFSALR